MATTPVTLNGTTYFVPQPGEQGPTYDQDLTNYLIALATAFPQGGANPSSTFQALVSATANPAQTGQLRLAATDLITVRNQTNTNDDKLGVTVTDDVYWTNATTGRVNTLSGHPCLHAHGGTTQSGITTGTTILFSNVDLDTDSGWNAGSGIYTVQANKGGFYIIGVALQTTQNTATGTQLLTLQANGVTTIGGAQITGMAAASTGIPTCGEKVPAWSGRMRGQLKMPATEPSQACQAIRLT